MRIALILEVPPQTGGGFQQSLTTISAARLLPGHEIEVLTTLPSGIALMRDRSIPCRKLRYPLLHRRIDRLMTTEPALRDMSRKVRKAIGITTLTYIDSLLKANAFDLTIFLGPSPLSIGMLESPFFASVWDLAHREHPEFPEVRGSFVERERILIGSLARAVRVIVNCESLGQQLSRHYGVEPTRLLQLPFLPSIDTSGPATAEDVQRVRQSYGLAEDYVFYPAQFWAHKNHVYLLQGLRALEERHGVRMHAAFAGTDAGNLGHVQQMAQALGLSDRTHFLGFVPGSDLAALYTGASALVMPSYFGPTNIPPLEAFATGCPVIYSDLPDFRNDLGTAALYCDLASAGSLAEQLAQLLRSEETRRALARAGTAFLQRASISTYVDRLGEAIAEFAYIRARWTDR